MSTATLSALEATVLRLREAKAPGRLIMDRTGLTLYGLYKLLAALRRRGVAVPYRLQPPPRGPLIGTPSTRAIQQAVSIVFGVSPHHMIGPSRYTAHVEARRVVMYLARGLRGASFPEIGREIGGWHHSTVMLGVRVIERMVAADADFSAKVEAARATALASVTHGGVPARQAV